MNYYHFDAKHRWFLPSSEVSFRSMGFLSPAHLHPDSYRERGGAEHSEAGTEFLALQSCNFTVHFSSMIVNDNIALTVFEFEDLSLNKELNIFCRSFSAELGPLLRGCLEDGNNKKSNRSH